MKSTLLRNNLFYYLTAFVSGAAVMATELTASRLLAPYFGSSLFVWTNVIGLVMLALSVGYFVGGVLSDKHPEPHLYFGFLFFTGLWVMAIPFISTPLFTLLIEGFSDLSRLVVLGSLIAVAVLLIFPMIFLGMMVPFTVKLVTDRLKNVGTYSGRVSMVSTAGSLLGTFLPAFVLVPWLGTSQTFLATGLVLLLFAALGLRKWWPWLLFLLAVGSFLWVPPAFAFTAMVHQEESAYGSIYVREFNGGERYLYVDSPFGIQSVYKPDTVLTGHYYDYFGLLPALIDYPQRVLILGHSGGSFTRLYNHFYPNLEVTGVEIDPAITRVAEEWMGLDEAEVQVVHGDARGFLQSTQNRYDLILVDAYHSSSIPPHLATQEFFEQVREHLAEGGVAALNVAASEGEFLDTFVNTFHSVFPVAAKLPIPNAFNTMVLGRAEGDFELDFAPSDLAYAKDWFDAEREISSYDEDAGVFRDEFISEVELKSEGMLLELYKNY